MRGIVGHTLLKSSHFLRRLLVFLSLDYRVSLTIECLTVSQILFAWQFNSEELCELQLQNMLKLILGAEAGLTSCIISIGLVESI